MGCGCFPERKKDELLQNACESMMTVPLSQLNTESDRGEGACTGSMLYDVQCELKHCMCITRVIDALRYYDNIDIIKNQTEFTEFVHKRDINLVNDFDHVLATHEDDILAIHTSLFEQHNVSQCKWSQCMMTHRNQRDRNEEDVNYDIDNDQMNNIELTFWIDLLDKMHCYLLHIYDYGYRMQQNTDNMSQIKQYIAPKRKALDHVFGDTRSRYKYNLIIPQHHVPQSDLNIGLKYYYWEHYKAKNEYIARKYRGLKEEILNNTQHCLDSIKYSMAAHKTNKMMQSAHAKSLSAHFICDRHYGIAPNSCIRFEHLLSIVLYVDYDMLSQTLCTTYAAQTPDESVLSVRKRHCELGNWSQHLRETVDYFGVNTSELNSSCYVGCRYIVVPALCIRLRAPTSTSKHLVTAMRFVHDVNDGMVLQLTHNAHGSNDIKGFPCDWLSNVSGEGHVLFMGGKHTIKLERVWSLKNNQDFGTYFTSMYYFDLMLCGVQISEDEATSISDQLLDTLINQSTCDIVHQMFDLYCAAKETIIIDLLQMDSVYKVWRAFITCDQSMIAFPRIGLLFQNVTQIAIYASTPQYQMDFLQLLQQITKAECHHFKRIQIRCNHHQSWLCLRWNKEIRSKFYAQKWKAKLVLGKSTNSHDVLTLTNQTRDKLRRRATD